MTVPRGIPRSWRCGAVGSLSLSLLATGCGYQAGAPAVGETPSSLTKPFRVKGDFDGDQRADLATFRPSDGNWYIKTARKNLTISWGIAGDVPVAEDYDGDRKADPAVWRPSTGEWWVLSSANGAQPAVTWGAPGDIPVPADYDGDGIADIAVWRPGNGTWYVIRSSDGQVATTNWGVAGDVPVPSDYDSDGKVDVAVWRPSSGTWFAVGSRDGATTSVGWGTSGDVPLALNPLDTGVFFDTLSLATQLAVWRPSTRQLFVYDPAHPNNVVASPGFDGTPANAIPVVAKFEAGGQNYPSVRLWDPGTGRWGIGGTVAGKVGDIPATTPARRRHVKVDYNGDGKSDRLVWRPSDGKFYKQFDGSNRAFGAFGDLPVTGDFDGDGYADIATYRAALGTWYTQRTTEGRVDVVLGLFPNGPGLSEMGIAVPGDYDGDGKTDIAVWTASDGTWHIISSATGQLSVTNWGQPGDIPAPGDYDGDGRTDMVVFRPGTGTWWVNGTTGQIIQRHWGELGDRPAPGDYDGDGIFDFAVFRRSNSTWFVARTTLPGQTVQWGNFQVSADSPVPGDYDGDGVTDIAVWRPTNGNWYVLGSVMGGNTIQWGDTRDIPLGLNYDDPSNHPLVPAPPATPPPAPTPPPASTPSPPAKPPSNRTCGKMGGPCCAFGECDQPLSSSLAFCGTQNTCQPCGTHGLSCCFHFAINQVPDCASGGADGCNPDTGTCF